MPNVIKYTTGATETGCLRKGNMQIGNNTADYGATFWNGITPPNGGYTIYLNKANNGPSIYCPANDTQLIGITNQIAGTNYTTAVQCFNYFTSQTDKVLVNQDYPTTFPYIVMDGLILYLDAGITQSYPGSGTTWTDVNGLGSKNNGTLVNGPTYTSSNSGSIVFDGVDDYITTLYVPGAITSQSIGCWINKTNLQYSFILATDTIYFGFEIYPTTIYANITNSDYGYVSYNTNGPQNVVFTYDGSQTGNSNRLKIYLNGTLQTLAFVGTIPTSTTVPGIVIGKRWWSSKYSDGSISTLSIYNRALTSAEVLQNYNAQKGRFGL